VQNSAAHSARTDTEQMYATGVADDLGQTTLEACLEKSQHERVILTRNGKPVALIVNVEGLDAEQIELGGSDRFWKLMAERRAQFTISREQLEEQLPDE
jgi:antitoxin (DNA-binding transcriptional repressor) of toxin-antitoxin stability system